MPPAGRVLLIDTNLLVLLVVGLVDPQQIERFKRTRAYKRADFELLRSFVDGFDALVTTPNVLTEASNLAGQLAEPLRRTALAALAAIAHGADERYYASGTLVQEPIYLRLGLTDTAVAVAARENVAVLTDDLDLYGRLANAGATVYNFTHLRFPSADDF
jgi:hypothetical protein